MKSKRGGEFSVEYVAKRFGSFRPLAEAIRDGRILGVVNMVGCNNPKALYEKTIVDVADVLLENGVLILTNGCASFSLMKLGYCNVSALSRTNESLRDFLSPDLPPVWRVGERVDNARSSGIFAGVANVLEKRRCDLPFAFASPEWGTKRVSARRSVSDCWA